jgi:pilus assembly protein Flp/PilA
MLDMLRTYLHAWTKSEEGATAVEYGIMVALIAVVIIGAVTALGLAVSGTFGDAAAGMP